MTHEELILEAEKIATQTKLSELERMVIVIKILELAEIHAMNEVESVTYEYMQKMDAMTVEVH